MTDPKLRQDFPVDWAEDEFVSRREFFKFLTLASGGLAAGSIGVAAWSESNRHQRTFEPRKIALAEDLKAGDALAFSYPRDSDICLLIRRPSGDLRAYSRRCTHLSCPVNYESDKDRLYCPCHNGAFSAETGAVVQGPPPHPLPEVLLEVRMGEIWAVGLRSSEAI